MRLGIHNHTASKLVPLAPVIHATYGPFFSPTLYVHVNRHHHFSSGGWHGVAGDRPRQAGRAAEGPRAAQQEEDGGRPGRHRGLQGHSELEPHLCATRVLQEM